MHRDFAGIRVIHREKAPDSQTLGERTPRWKQTQTRRMFFFQTTRRRANICE